MFVEFWDKINDKNVVINTENISTFQKNEQGDLEIHVMFSEPVIVNQSYDQVKIATKTIHYSEVK